MRFDTIIIGGGLSGLIVGLILQGRGQRTMLVSSGESALHFFSGSFDLLGRLEDGTEVIQPLEALRKLDSRHPYRLMGRSRMEQYARDVVGLFGSCGIRLNGDVHSNHLRATPLGELRPTWLSLDGFPMFTPGTILRESVLLVSFRGFMDYYPEFLRDALVSTGAGCRVETLDLPFLKRLRMNPTEMRSTQVACQMEIPGHLEQLAQAVSSLRGSADVVALPAVFSMDAAGRLLLERLEKLIGCRIMCLPTMGLSVPGSSVQIILQKKYEEAGGTLLLGDTVEHVECNSGRVLGVRTHNHGDNVLRADQFILSSGSFFSKGLGSAQDRMFEPLMDLDMVSPSARPEWYCADLMGPQPYMSAGVAYDDRLHPLLGGRPVENLHVCGSILGGRDALSMASGGGLAMLSACWASELV